MGRICLAAHLHRDAWPTTYSCRCRIRPIIERSPGTAPLHGRAPRQRCAGEESSWPTMTAGSEEKQISCRSSCFDELKDRSFRAATGEDGCRAGRRRLDGDRCARRDLGLEMSKRRSTRDGCSRSVRGRRSALWCRIAPVAWLGDGASSGGLGGWSSRLHLATASRWHSRRWRAAAATARLRVGERRPNRGERWCSTNKSCWRAAFKRSK
jgi:hypothetical protein